MVFDKVIDSLIVIKQKFIFNFNETLICLPLPDKQSIFVLFSSEQPDPACLDFLDKDVPNITFSIDHKPST